MSAAVETISARGGAWRRLVLGGGRGNLLSLELVRALGEALHALESERGIKWLTIEGSGGEFSFGARIQEHTPEMMRDGPAGNASHHQAAARVSGADRGAGRRPVPRRRLRARAGVRRHHRARHARRSVCPRSGWRRSRQPPRRCCRCASARRAPRARSSPARRRTRDTGTTPGLLSMVAPQAGLMDAAAAWFDAHLAPHSAIALSHAVVAARADAARAGGTGARSRGA